MGLLMIVLAWGPKANIYNFALFKIFAEFTDKVQGGGSLLSGLTNAVKKKLFDRHQGNNFQKEFSTLHSGIDLDYRKLSE